jgi:hypothetical protein
MAERFNAAVLKAHLVVSTGPRKSGFALDEAQIWTHSD